MKVFFFGAEDISRPKQRISLPPGLARAAAILMLGLPTICGLAAPAIVVDPTDVEARIGTEAVFSVTATSRFEVIYQWYENGVPLPGEFNSNLVLKGVQPVEGVYQREYHVEVGDLEGTNFSQSAHLTILAPPNSSTIEITTQPQSQALWPGTNVTFEVAAASDLPLTFQWYEDGVELLGETNTTLTRTNLQVVDSVYERRYHAMISDESGAVASDPAVLTILEFPAILQQPRSQYVLVGGTVELDPVVTGTPPFGFRWRRNGLTLTNSRASRIVLSNVQPADAGTYSLVVTNRAFWLPGILGVNMRVFVCEDTDGNDLPDCWQQVFHFFGAQTGRDDDPDLDGISNYDEYFSGTNPLNPESVLKFSSIDVESARIVSLNFLASSNTSYTVQSRPSSTVPRWTKLVDVYAHETNRLVSIIHTNFTGQSSFYRLVTPRLP